jgi:hypothetical protein
VVRAHPFIIRRHAVIIAEYFLSTNRYAGARTALGSDMAK